MLNILDLATAYTIEKRLAPATYNSFGQPITYTISGYDVTLKNNTNVFYSLTDIKNAGLAGFFKHYTKTYNSFYNRQTVVIYDDTINQTNTVSPVIWQETSFSTPTEVANQTRLIGVSIQETIQKNMISQYVDRFFSTTGIYKTINWTPVQPSLQQFLDFINNLPNETLSIFLKYNFDNLNLAIVKNNYTDQYNQLVNQLNGMGFNSGLLGNILNSSQGYADYYATFSNKTDQAELFYYMNRIQYLNPGVSLDAYREFYWEAKRRQALRSDDSLLDKLGAVLQSGSFISLNGSIAVWSIQNPDQALLAAVAVYSGVGLLEGLSAAVSAGSLTYAQASQYAAVAGIVLPKAPDAIANQNLLDVSIPEISAPDISSPSIDTSNITLPTLGEIKDAISNLGGSTGTTAPQTVTTQVQPDGTVTETKSYTKEILTAGVALLAILAASLS